MKAKNNELTVESMTQRYSLGHKALSVALSVVLMGFGWPAVSPSQVYAGDGAAADDAAAQVEGASSAAATSSADKAADTAASSAASATSSAAPVASEQPASTTSQQQAASGASESAQPAATQQVESAKDDAGTADVELVLGNASITYMDQVISAPAHKVTVPVKDDFKFTVSPDNGYNLTKAVLKVSGKENPISPDDQGVYTVSAADVAAGATVTLETEAVSSDSGKDTAVSIEDDATEETQVSVSGTGAISGPTSVAQSDEITLADSTKKPDNTAFEKWIYVGETATYQGTSGKKRSSSWWYSGKDEGFISFKENGDSVTVTGHAKGDVVLMHRYYNNNNRHWTTEQLTIHVLPKAPITSLEITGDGTVEQFKSITLKTNADTGVTWTSSDPSVATIDASGKVVGVKAGKVTITATVTAEGKVLTATHEVTVTESTAQQKNANLFFLKSPTNNPDSNSASDWYPTGGKSDLGVKVNIEGAAFSGKNTWDNVANRVVKWPDGSAGSSWTLPQTNSYWDKVFDSYKSEIEDKLQVSISKDDVEAIVLHPYKISNNSGTYHLDCKVEIKVKKVVTATFWLQSAGATGFDKQYSVSTLEVKDGAVQVVAPDAPEAEKIVDGVKYKFMGWYSDQACTQPVTFPVTTVENVFYYGKYVPCDQSIQVNYYLDKTNTPVAPSQTLSGYMKGQTVTQTPIDIPGYTPVSTDAKTGMVGTDSSIDFYYTANPVGYRVEYYWTGSDTPLSSEKRSGHVGDQVTGLQPKEFKGYTPVSDNVQDLKLGAKESDNVVTFYYRQNVSLTANSDDTKTYNGFEQSVEGYTTKLPDGKDVSTSFDGVTLEGGKGTNAGDYPYTFAEGTIGKVSSDNGYVVTQMTPGNLHISPVTDKVTVTITGKSAKLPYNGSEQSVTGYSFAASDNRYSEANVKFQGEAVAKGTNVGTYKMNLASGQFSNISGNFANVDFVVNDGSLKIEGGTIDSGKVVWDVHLVQKVYDDTPLSAYVAKATDKFGNTLKVEYSTDGKQWTDNPSEITLTHVGYQEVKLRATSANYDAGQYAENAEPIMITKRLVKLASKGDNKKYDGKPLTNHTVTVTPKGEGIGFIDGEGVTIKVTGSQTDAGESDNTFEYTFNEGTNANDYLVTTELGKLVVTASDSEVVVTIAGHNKTVEYNGSEQSVEGYDFVEEASSPLYKEGDFTFSGEAVAKGTNVGTYNMNLASEQFANTSKNFSKVTFAVTDGTLTITPKSIVPDPENPKNTMSVDSPADVVYNGRDQTWTPVVKDGERTLEAGKDYTVEYSTADRTNVGEVTVTITGAGNYSDSVTRTYQITKRPVELKSQGGSKPYDGTALVKPEVSGWQQLGDTGFVEGEASDVRATGSVTTVAQGEVTNPIAYDTSAGFNANNYAISKDEGVLSVTAKQIAAADMTVQAPADVVYSGKAQQQKPVVKDGDKVLAEGVDYEPTYSGNATDAGAVTVTVTGKGDYAGSVDVAYQIAPAPLTVATESANKVYDGKPLTAGGKVDGLVNGETVAFKLVGSQTKVGSSDNAYRIEWSGTAKRANYRLEAETIGKLTVTESADEVVVTTTGGTFTYDGASHGATVKVANLPEGYSLETAESAASAKDVSDGEVAATADVLVIKNAQGEDVTSKLNVKFVDGTIKVEPAKLTVTTPSVSKPYDGDALTAEGKVSGFVNGEAATLKITGSQTEVGSSVNGYELVWDGSAKAANYTVEENLGTLTVSAQSINPDDAGAFGGVTVGYLADAVYNGADQRFEPEVVDKDGKALVKGLDYELSFSGDMKNVGEVTVTVVGKGNYAGSVERTYRIAPAPLTVTTGSDSKIYDGGELTNSELTIEGLQGEDRVTAATTGSQTEVGSSENTYRITWGDVDAANYVIDEHLGTLTVTPAPVPPTPEPTPEPEPTPTPEPEPTPTPTPTPEPTPTPGDGETPTPNPTPGDDVTPAPNPIPDGTTPSGGTTPAPASTPDGATTAPAPTPAPAAAGPLDALADVLEGAYESVTGSPEADNPVEEERIYDAENPLGRESVEDHCWVHWYMIVGMVMTAVYGLAAALRRKNHERKLRNDMNDVLGDGDGKDPSGSPAAKPAGMEA